jgi:diguanylate cyclase (GGDEF)-like protein
MARVADPSAGTASRAVARFFDLARHVDRAVSVVLKLVFPVIAAGALFAFAGTENVLLPALRAAGLRAEERRALAVAEVVGAHYESHTQERGETALFLSQLVRRDPSLHLVRVYKVEGGSPVVWASSRPEDVTAHRPEPHDVEPLSTGSSRQEVEVRDGEEVLKTVQLLRTAGVPDATVGVYSSLDPLHRATENLTWRFLLLSIAVAGLQAAAVLAVLGLVVLRPIARLHRAAVRVASGDLSVRLPEGAQPPARDEIARIAGEFDRMVRAVAQQRATDERLAATDGLTGLPNRRAFDAQLGSEIARAERLGYALTLSLIDLDGFKALNDSVGHLAGDDALRRVARALTEAVRRTDIVARYGGDEFAVIHPGCDATAAAAVGVRARANVEELGIRMRDRRLLSASVGIAEHGPAVAAEDLISTADAALYRAKAQGGGVEVATAAGGTPLR